jgi:hypothetical protein
MVSLLNVSLFNKKIKHEDLPRNDSINSLEACCHQPRAAQQAERISETVLSGREQALTIALMYI